VVSGAGTDGGAAGRGGGTTALDGGAVGLFVGGGAELEAADGRAGDGCTTICGGVITGGGT
jgi:hypothetical protein